MATVGQIDALVDAMAQLLDDMGESGTCVCLHAKAAARLAYEPFRELDYEPGMSLTEARKIVDAHT